MLQDYGAHVTAVTTHSSLLQNRNTESKNHSLQKLKNNKKKCSSKYEIKAYGYFLQELLQRKRGSLQDTTEQENATWVYKFMRSTRTGAQACTSYYVHHSFLTHEGNYILQ